MSTTNRTSQPLGRPWQMFSLMHSRYLLTVAATLAILLIAFDAFAISRAIQGNPYPYWKANTDFGGYLRASAAFSQGKDVYTYEPCPCNMLYGTREIHDQYTYPPFFAALLVPLAYAGDVAARYLWLFISLGCIAGSLILLLRGFGARLAWPWIAMAFGIICLSRIGRNDLYHGQVNFLLMFLITLGLWLYTRDRPAAAGAVLAIAFVIKPFLGIILVYFLWRRQWRTACACVLTGGILFILSFVPLLPANGLSIIQSWVATSAYYSSGAVAARPDNYSLNGVLLRLFNPNYFTVPWFENIALVRILSVALIMFLLATFGAALSSNRAWQAALRETPAMLLVEVGLLVGLTMSYGPMTELDHFFMLVPGLIGVILLAQQRHASRSVYRKLWWWVAAAWVFFFAFHASPIKLNLGFEAAETWTQLAGPAILLTGRIGLMLLAITGLLAYVLRRERKTIAYSSV